MVRPTSVGKGSHKFADSKNPHTQIAKELSPSEAKTRSQFERVSSNETSEGEMSAQLGDLKGKKLADARLNEEVCRGQQNKDAFGTWLEEERETAKQKELSRQNRKKLSKEGQEARANKIFKILIEKEKNLARFRQNLKTSTNKSHHPENTEQEMGKPREDLAKNPHPKRADAGRKYQGPLAGDGQRELSEQILDLSQSGNQSIERASQAETCAPAPVKAGAPQQVGAELISQDTNVSFGDSLVRALRLFSKKANLEHVLDDPRFSEKFANLRKVLSGVEGEHMTFNWASFIQEVREGLEYDESYEAFSDLSFELYSNLDLLPFATSWFAQNELFAENFENMSLLQQLKSICKNIGKMPVTLSKQVIIQLTKLGSKANYMDSTKDNPFFKAGDFTYLKTDSVANDNQKLEGIERTCAQLRHPTPTIETPGIPQSSLLNSIPILSGVTKKLAPKIEICPIYWAFVGRAAQLGKIILYSNHQANSHDEANRVAVLANFSEKFAENHIFITLPYRHHINDEHCEDIPKFCEFMRDFICDCDQVAPEKCYFPPSCREFVKLRAGIWADFFRDHLIREGELESQPRRCMYLTLFQSFIRGDLIRKFDVDYCNDTCKDAIDRGALHLFADVLWAQVMASQDQDSDSRKQLAVLTLYPALFARMRPILEDKLEIITELAQKIDSLDKSAKEMLRQQWKRSAGLRSLKFFFRNADWRDHFTYKIDQIGDEPLAGATKENWHQLEKDLKRNHGLVIERQNCTGFDVALVQKVLCELFRRFQNVNPAMTLSKFDCRVSSIAVLLSQALIADCTKKARLFAKMLYPTHTDTDLVHGNPPPEVAYRPVSKLIPVEGKAFPEHFSIEVAGQLWVEKVEGVERQLLTKLDFQASTDIDGRAFFQGDDIELQFECQLRDLKIAH